MKTIIAEKPSVAREIARIVGATKREEGYFEGGGYAVTWAFGHLVQLAMPDGYGVRGFVRDNVRSGRRKVTSPTAAWCRR